MAAKEKKSVPEIGYAHAVRDIFIAAINRGQLPVLMLGVIILCLIWKTPEAEVGHIVRWMLDRLVDLQLLGWAAWLATVLGWYFHSAHARRKFVEALNQVDKDHRTGITR